MITGQTCEGLPPSMSTIAWGHDVVDRCKTCELACRFLKFKKMILPPCWISRSLRAERRRRSRELTRATSERQMRDKYSSPRKRLGLAQGQFTALSAPHIVPCSAEHIRPVQDACRDDTSNGYGSKGCQFILAGEWKEHTRFHLSPRVEVPPAKAHDGTIDECGAG